MKSALGLFWLAIATSPLGSLLDTLSPRAVSGGSRRSVGFAAVFSDEFAKLTAVASIISFIAGGLFWWGYLDQIERFKFLSLSDYLSTSVFVLSAFIIIVAATLLSVIVWSVSLAALASFVAGWALRRRHTSAAVSVLKIFWVCMNIFLLLSVITFSFFKLSGNGFDVAFAPYMFTLLFSVQCLMSASVSGILSKDQEDRNFLRAFDRSVSLSAPYSLAVAFVISSTVLGKSFFLHSASAAVKTVEAAEEANQSNLCPSQACANQKIKWSDATHQPFPVEKGLFYFLPDEACGTASFRFGVGGKIEGVADTASSILLIEGLSIKSTLTWCGAYDYFFDTNALKRTADPPSDFFKACSALFRRRSN